MPASRDLNSFGFVYGAYGTARGTTTSSAVFEFPTTFAKRVVTAFAWDEGFIGRNNAADPSQTTSLGTVTYFQPLTPRDVRARFRVYRYHVKSGGSAVFELLPATAWSTVVTGIRSRFLAFGY